jgi:hypothetical protein
MAPVGDILKQVAQICRNYPGIYTASEVVGRAFLLLDDHLGTTEKVRVLTASLKEPELRKLIQAAEEVAIKLDGVDEFKLGAVYVSTDGKSGIDIGDRSIPLGFVYALTSAAKPTSGSSAVG